MVLLAETVPQKRVFNCDYQYCLVIAFNRPSGIIINGRDLANCSIMADVPETETDLTHVTTAFRHVTVISSHTISLGLLNACTV